MENTIIQYFYLDKTHKDSFVIYDHKNNHIKSFIFISSKSTKDNYLSYL
jgi:hypothetical protein